MRMLRMGGMALALTMASSSFAPAQGTSERQLLERQLLQSPQLQRILQDPERQQQVMDDPRVQALMRERQVQRAVQDPRVQQQLQRNQQLQQMYQLQRRSLPGTLADDD